MSVLIEAKDLVKKYGDFVAVDGISFQIQDNECFGVLGPNGAGKTTLIRMLTTTSPVSEGILSVGGKHVEDDPRGVKSILGVVPQEDNLDPDLPVRKNLEVYARYHGIDRETAARRIGEALELFQLTEKSNSFPLNSIFSNFSHPSPVFTKYSPSKILERFGYPGLRHCPRNGRETAY